MLTVTLERGHREPGGEMPRRVLRRLVIGSHCDVKCEAFRVACLLKKRSHDYSHKTIHKYNGSHAGTLIVA